MTSDSVLILEGRQFYRELLAALLEKQGIQFLSAGSVAEGLRLAGREEVRVILADNELPGMSGLDFIQHVRQLGRATSAIILADGFDKNSVIRAARLRVRDLIVKGNLSAESLIARIRKRLEEATTPPAAPLPAPETAKPAAAVPAPAAAPVAMRPKPAATQKAFDIASVPQLLTRDKTLKRLEDVTGGKTIAGVVAQVVALASSPDADISDVVRVIQSDPILAARVLQLANSAATGVRHRAANIEEAARSIGLRGIQNMAVSIGIFGTFPPDETDGFNSMRCWQHSFAVAELMGMIVRKRNPNQEGVNHLVGLCHELGEILLRQHFSAEYDEILQIAHTHDVPVHQLVSTALGMRQPELVSRLLVRIGLPPHVGDAIREFHERQIREQAGGMSPEAQLLQTANIVAHGMLLAPSTHETVRPFSRTEWRNLSADRQPPEFDPVAKRNEIIVGTNAMARLPAAQEERFLKPILPNTSVRVGYLRSQTFIPFDPLAYALSNLAACEELSELPTLAQMQQLDGLVISAIRPGAAPAIPAELARLRANGGNAQFPILVLTGEALPAEINDPCTLWKTYPIRLIDLHQWLRMIHPANAGKIAAAH